MWVNVQYKVHLKGINCKNVIFYTFNFLGFLSFIIVLKYGAEQLNGAVHNTILIAKDLHYTKERVKRLY